MGLIKAASAAVSGVVADQWKEYFYCESLTPDILMCKGIKKTSATRETSNTKAEPNIITKGSIVAVSEGQFALIVEQGQIIDYCGEPGEFIWSDAGEPSLFSGSSDESLSKRLADVFHVIGRRISAGGDTMEDERVYFINAKEIYGNKYGTIDPIPVHIVDQNIGLDADISITCFGEYSYQIDNPLLFYKNVCGNQPREFRRQEIDSQMKSELMTALQTSLGKIVSEGVRYSQIPAHVNEVANNLSVELNDKWHNLRGIRLSSFGISSINIPDKDAQMIKDLQSTAVFKDPGMAAARLTSSQADALVAAASNENAGPVMAFAGLNLANNAGGANATKLFELSGQTKETPSSESNSVWTCECGATNNGNYCAECGRQRPANATSSTCPNCGWTGPASKFCPNCGAKL